VAYRAHASQAVHALCPVTLQQPSQPVHSLTEHGAQYHATFDVVSALMSCTAGALWCGMSLQAACMPVPSTPAALLTAPPPALQPGTTVSNSVTIQEHPATTMGMDMDMMAGEAQRRLCAWAAVGCHATGCIGHAAG
jgi:hypothetical protein